MLINHAKIFSNAAHDPILEDYSLLIREGIIQELGPTTDMEKRYIHEEVLDARGQYVMPGNICAHTHFYGAFSRGMPIPGSSPKDFPEILEKLWWNLDKALTLDNVYHSALVCMLDAVRHGTTTLVDHHASPNAIQGSLDQIARAAEETGLRVCLCYEVTDRDGEARTQAGIEENVRFIKRVQAGDNLDGRLTALFGLHASLTLSDETLKKCRQAAHEGQGFHVHVAEHPVDQYDALRKSGTRVVDRLNQFGVLGDRTIAVHAVHVDAREIEILSRTGTWVTHQPRSNMNNGVGLPDVESMARAGVKVCLGNDGFSNAMWEEWKTAYLAHKLYHRDPRKMNGAFLREIALQNNAQLASILFGKKIGVIEAGAQADLIFVDYHPYTPIDNNNLPWHIIFGFHESMITTTMVQGRVLMLDRELVGIDEEKLCYQIQKTIPEVWKRYQVYCKSTHMEEPWKSMT